MKPMLISVLIGFTAIASIASADMNMTGNELQEACKIGSKIDEDFAKNKENMKAPTYHDATLSFKCTMYLTGFLDGLDANKTIEKHTEQQKICLPKDKIDHRQLREIVLKWQNYNFMNLSLNAEENIKEALAEAYPCKKDK
jgi:hypothetical protein